MKIPVIVFFISLVASTILIITLSKVYDRDKELVNVGSKSLPPFPDVAPLVAAPEVTDPTTNLCVSLVGDETGGYVPSPMDPLTQCSSNADCDTCVTSPIEVPLECKAPTEVIAQQQSNIGNPGSKFCLPQTSTCLTQETLLACTHDADCASCSDEVGDGKALQCQIVTSPKKISLLDSDGEPLTQDQLANMNEEDMLDVPTGQWCLPKTGECHNENGVLHWTTAGWTCTCRFPAIHGGDNCSIFKACNNPLTTEWSSGNQQLLVNEDSPDPPQVWTMESGINPMLCHVEGVTNKAEWDKTCGVGTVPNAVCQCDGLMLESRMGFRNEPANPLTCTPDSCSVNALGGRTTEPLTMVDWSNDPNIPPTQCVCSGADARIWDIDNRNPEEVAETDPVLAETLRLQQGHVYTGRCRDTTIPTNGSLVVLKANRPKAGLGVWDQFRGIVNGNKVYVSTFENRTFSTPEVETDGTVWWSSQERNILGETLTELGFSEEIQGDERVVYVKMRGVSQWNENPSPESVHFQFWSVPQLYEESDSAQPYEIARVGVNEGFEVQSPLRIPFHLHRPGGVDSHSIMTFTKVADDPVCMLENNKHAETTSLVPGFAVDEAGNAEVSVCSADPCRGKYSDVNFRPPEGVQDWGHYNADIGARDCVSPGKSTHIETEDLTVNPVASVCVNACSGMESDDPNDWPCKQDPTRPCPQKPQCLTGEKGEAICVCAEGCGNVDGNTCMEKFDNFTSCHGYANMPNVCNSDDNGNPSRCLCHQGRSRDSIISSCENTSEWYSMCTTSLSNNPACHVGEDRNASLCGGDINFRCEGDAGCNTGGGLWEPDCGVPFTDRMVKYQVLSETEEDLTVQASLFDEVFDLATETTRVIRSSAKFWASEIYVFVMTVVQNPTEGTIRLTLEVNPTLDRTIVASKTFYCSGDCCLDDLMDVGKEPGSDWVLKFDEDYCDNSECGDGFIYFKRIP